MYRPILSSNVGVQETGVFCTLCSRSLLRDVESALHVGAAFEVPLSHGLYTDPLLLVLL